MAHGYRKASPSEQPRDANAILNTGAKWEIDRVVGAQAVLVTHALGALGEVHDGNGEGESLAPQVEHRLKRHRHAVAEEGVVTVADRRTYLRLGAEQQAVQVELAAVGKFDGTQRLILRIIIHD